MIVALFVVLVLPFAALSSSQTGIVTTSGDSFYLNGTVFNFVGANFRGISHYGHGDALPYSSASDQDINLQGLASMSGSVARLFASYHKISSDETLARLKTVLDKFAQYDIRAIVCFTDSYTSGYSPMGDDNFYVTQPNGWTILDDSWFSSGWKLNYWPQVEKIVTSLSDHTAVFAWEIGNELQEQKNPANMVTFASDVSARIRGIDKNHMITTGFISADHTLMNLQQAMKVYSSENISFITYHTYNGDNSNTNINKNVYCSLNKPMIVEEFGWTKTSPQRDSGTQDSVNYWFDSAYVRGYGQWGVQYQNNDIGDGDNDVGMDKYSFTDFNTLFGIYKTRGDMLRKKSQDQNHQLSPYCKTL